MKGSVKPLLVKTYKLKPPRIFIIGVVKMYN